MSARSINVTFSADTGQFVANVDGMSKATARASEAVAEAKNKITAAFKAEMQAAKEAGASQEELAAITRKYAQQRIEAEEQTQRKLESDQQAYLARRYSNLKAAAEREANLQATTSQQQTRAAQLAVLRTDVQDRNAPQGFWSKLLGNSAEVSETASTAARVAGSVERVGEAGAHMATRTQMASASLRALQGNFTNNLCVSENFAATLPGLSTLFAKAFPIVGAVALTAELYRGVHAVEEWKEKLDKLPIALRDGFESITSPMLAQADALHKTNTELEVSIAHLEHKPANALALAMDEARIYADSLTESATRAQQSVEKLLKENGSGLFAQLVMGKGNTGPISDEVNKRMGILADLQRADRDALHSGTDTTAAQSARQTQIRDAQNAFLAYVRETCAKINGKETLTAYGEHGKVGSMEVPYAQVNGDQSANNRILNGVEDYLRTTQDLQTERERNAADVVKQKQLQAAEQLKQQTTEAMRKANEAQRNQWKLEDDARKQNGTDSGVVEVNTWDRRVAGLKLGSEQYIYAQNELTQKLTELRAKDAEAAKQAAAKAEKDQRDAWDLMHDDWVQAAHRTAQDEVEFWSIRALEALNGGENYKRANDKLTQAIREQQRQEEEAAKARNRAALQRGEQGTAYEQAQLGITVRTGRISALDAAVVQASIHLEEYRQQMGQLQDELARQTALDPTSADTVNAQAAVDRAASERSIQAIQDQANISANTIKGAFTNAIDEWSQHARDTASQLRGLFNQGMDGLNDNLTNQAFGDRQTGVGS